MDFSVYVLGDVSSFYSTINGVAMIFKSSGFMNGVYLVGGFIALISGIMFMIQKGEESNSSLLMGQLVGYSGSVWWSRAVRYRHQ